MKLRLQVVLILLPPAYTQRQSEGGEQEEGEGESE